MKDAGVDLPKGLADAKRQDTTKFRIYADRGNKEAPALTHRFDLDVVAPAFAIPSELPQPDAVVIADFQKGIVTKALLAKLAGRFGKVP